MKYGYTRVSTKGQLDGNSIEEQTTAIHNIYADAEIIVESYSGAKESLYSINYWIRHRVEIILL